MGAVVAPKQAVRLRPPLGSVLKGINDAEGALGLVKRFNRSIATPNT